MYSCSFFRWFALLLLVIAANDPLRSFFSLSSCFSSLIAAQSLAANVSVPLSRAPANCSLFDHAQRRIAHKVLIFLDTQFFHVFQNWLRFYEQICTPAGKEQLELICIEDKVRNMLWRQEKLNCSLRSWDIEQKKEYGPRSGKVWLKRLEIVIELLQDDFDLLLSDVDALWLRNPYPHLQEHRKKVDIIASRGWWPWVYNEKWGSTLCMGFAYVKPSAFTIALFKEVLVDMEHTHDLMLRHHEWLAERRALERNMIQAIKGNRRVLQEINVQDGNSSRISHRSKNITYLPTVNNKRGSLGVNDTNKLNQARIDSRSKHLSDENGCIHDSGNNQTDLLHWSDCSDEKELEAFSKRVTQSPDDQYSINHILFTWNITWQVTSFDWDQFAIGSLTFNQTPHSVLLLPHQQYMRNCLNFSEAKVHQLAKEIMKGISIDRNRFNNTIIAHCVAYPGEGRRKAWFLAKLGLWKLNFMPYGNIMYQRLPQYYRSSVTKKGPNFDKHAVLKARLQAQQRQYAAKQLHSQVDTHLLATLARPAQMPSRMNQQQNIKANENFQKKIVLQQKQMESYRLQLMKIRAAAIKEHEKAKGQPNRILIG